MSDTYSDVDARTGFGDDVVAWQERVDGWPQVRAYKRRSYELCGDAGARLDVGAGPGTDAAVLGAVACDPSMAMCRAAIARDVPVVRADGTRCPSPMRHSAPSAPIGCSNTSPRPSVRSPR